MQIWESVIKNHLKDMSGKEKTGLIGATLFIIGLSMGLLIRGDHTPEPLQASHTVQAYTDSTPAEDPPSIEATQAHINPALIEDTGEAVEKPLVSIRLKRGQGLMDLLITNGAKPGDAYKAIKALSRHYDMRKLQIGQQLQVGFDDSGLLIQLDLLKNFDQKISISRHGELYQSVVDQLPTLNLTRHAEGVIEDSLFMAGLKQGLPNSVIVDLIRIFSFDVDFQREIRKGDRFEILYERRLSEDGARVEEGNILFARLTLRGKPINLYRYKPEKNPFADYFHESGKSAKRALMKTPIEGARLSSYYGKRKHPVLGYTRMHKGLDFSAPTGTPIMAAGDGIIERSSRYGSYGNYVRIRHNDSYKTAYAHLSRYGRGIKSGKRVKQGQIIGYVGATGRVTGRHLHYEVFHNGKQVNPLRLKIPTGITLKGTEKEKFQTVASDLDHRIQGLKDNILLAWRMPQNSENKVFFSNISP